MNVGQEFTTHSGNRLRVTGLLPGGGESRTCKVQNLTTGRTEVLKIFNNLMPMEQRRQRTQFLIDRKLEGCCYGLCGPRDWLEVGGAIAHTSKYIEGVRLEEFLHKAGQPYPANVKLALMLALSIAQLNRLGLAHGDLHPGNFIVVGNNSRYLLFVIDLDNFHSPNAAPPSCVGHLLFMSPELRRSHTAGRVVPNEKSDCFALAAIFHELLLVKQFTAGFDGSQEEFETAAQCGKWLHDPAGDTSASHGTGFSSRILNPELCGLFRQSFSLVPEERPTAEDWAKALERGYSEIHLHAKCGGTVFVDSSKTICPHCGKKFPLLKLVLVGSGREVVVDSASVPIGRDFLGSRKGSAHHAVFRRYGPETRVETFGRNGMFRKNGDHWMRIQDGVSCLIENGDVLRFADVECRVEEIPA